MAPGVTSGVWVGWDDRSKDRCCLNQIVVGTQYGVFAVWCFYRFPLYRADTVTSSIKINNSLCDPIDHA